MAAEVRDWFQQGPDERGGFVRIPDDDEFAEDMKAIPELDFAGSKGQFFLPGKEKIKEDHKKSTDCFDALCLTFAFPVLGTGTTNLILPSAYQQPSSMLSTENTFRELQGQNQTDTMNPNFKYYTFGGS